MKLLIVEDDFAIATALREGLHRIYIVDIASTGAQAIRKAELNDYAVITLDLSLPDVGGLKVCKQLRDGGVTAPILVVTGQAEVTDKISLLDAGADDYLTKPFSLEELKARLRALVRRQSRDSRSCQLVVGELSLDTATRRIERLGKPIRLRRKEFELLEYMMYHAGTVVTRATIVDQIWDTNDGLWTNSIDVHIKYLRDKIDRPFDFPMIKTIHGIGYKLETSNPVAPMHK
jgi:two-component system, OmpR family, response regulator